MFRFIPISKITCVAANSVYGRTALLESVSRTKWKNTVVVYRLYSADKKGGKKGGGGAESCPPKDAEGCSSGKVPGPCPGLTDKKVAIKKKPVEKKVCPPPSKSIPYEKPKLTLRECRPIDIKPCAPDPPDAHSKIPPLNDCNRPNLMNDCPKPVCMWEEENKRKRSGYARILLLGLLATALTIGALYFIGLYTPIEEKPKKKVVKKEKKVIRKIPENSGDIPSEVPYLLIGGGTASFSAFRAIKSADPTAQVLVISDELSFPYMRPPLSKEMWFNDDANSVKKLIFKQWNGSERSLFYEPDDFYTDCKQLMSTENGGVAVARGWSIDRIDPCERVAYLEDGKEIRYGKALIATGAKPKNLIVFESASENDNVVAENVKLFRNVEDFQQAFEKFENSKNVTIIGGGFAGSELACAMARRGKKARIEVTQVFREAGNMGKVLPEYLSFWTTEKVKAEGVNVISNAEVTAAKSEGDKVVMTLSNGRTLKSDLVIVAVGVQPNTKLAETSDLEVDPDLGGFLVNTELMARSNLYIAGDCACFYDAKLGRRRIEHHDHAVVSGRLAGENMSGSCNTYVHQSMFWSDLGPDVGYEAIGIVDAALPTVGVFAKATDKDNPKAVVTATDEGIRSKTEEVPAECKKFMKGDEQTTASQQCVKSRKDSQPQPGEDFGKGVIFYLRDDIVVGIVLWNVFNRMSIARQVLKDEKKYDDLNEVAKLFNIHEE